MQMCCVIEGGSAKVCGSVKVRESVRESASRSVCGEKKEAGEKKDAAGGSLSERTCGRGVSAVGSFSVKFLGVVCVCCCHSTRV